MFNNSKKKEKFSRKSARALLASLAVSIALSCGLTGCDFNKTNEDSLNSQDLNLDHSIESIYEDEHKHDEDDDFVIVDDDEDNQDDDDDDEDDETDEDEDEDEKDETDPELVNFDVPNIGDYDGVSLIDALKLSGYEYSFEYRSKLAKYYGIENYRGTAEQNSFILSCLKEYAKAHKQEDNTSKPTQDEENVHTHSFGTPIASYTDINDDTHTQVVVSSCDGCDATTTKTIVSSHSYGEWKDNGDGTESRSCEDCGHVMTRQKQVVHEHKFVEGAPVYTNINDLTHDLLITSTCECGESKVMIKKFSHKYGEWKDSGEGTESRSCEECGHVMTRKKQDVHIHNFKNPVVTYTNKNDATHDVVTTSTCECGETKILTKTLGHNYGAWVNNGDGTESRTCGDCGYVMTRNIQKPHIHHFTQTGVTYSNENDFTHDKTVISTCSCGETKVYTLTLSHNYSPWKDNGDGTESRTCSECGHVMTRKKQDVHIHNFKNPVVTYANKNAATHDVVTTSTCECGETKTLTKTLGHTFGAWVNNGDGTESRTCEDCGYVMTKKHNHNYVAGKPTYTDKNDKTHTEKIVSTCKCGDEKIASGKEEHTYGKWIIGKEEETRTCGECDYIMTIKHEHDYDVKTTYSSVDEENHTKTVTSTCKCGDEKKNDYLLSHDYKWKNNGNGTETGTCEECKHEKTRKIQISHDHSYVPGTPTYKDKDAENHTKTTVSTCSCGDVKTVTEDENHKYGDWTIGKDEETKSCKECGHKITQKHTHNYDEENAKTTYSIIDNDAENHTKTVTSTCSSCGDTKKDVKVLGHTFGDWTKKDEETETRTCSECGYVITRKIQKPHDHSYVKGEPTYKDKDAENHTKTTISTCSCGDVKTDTEDEKHNYGDWTIGKEEESKTCEDCGHKITQKHTHNYDVKTTYLSVDDDKHTKTETSTCSSCGDVKTDTEDENHKYGDWTIGKEEETKSCKECGHKITQKHTHNYDAKTTYSSIDNNDVNHTKTVTSTCSSCGDEKIDTFEEKHNYCEWTIGEKEESRTCGDCGYVMTRDIQKPHEHSFGVWVNNDDGTHTRTCKECGSTETKEHTNTTETYNAELSRYETVCNDCCEIIETRDHTHTPGRTIYDEYGEHQLCAEDESHVIDTKSHVYGEPTERYEKSEDKHALCIEEGCTNCGFVHTISKGSDEDHSFLRTDFGFCGGSNPAHCSYENYKCTTCHYEKTEYKEHNLNVIGDFIYCSNNCGYIIPKTSNPSNDTSSDGNTPDNGEEEVSPTDGATESPVDEDTTNVEGNVAGEDSTVIDGENSQPLDEQKDKGTSEQEGQVAEDSTTEGEEQKDEGAPDQEEQTAGDGTTEGEEQKDEGAPVQEEQVVEDGTIEGEEQKDEGIPVQEEQVVEDGTPEDEVQKDEGTPEQEEKVVEETHGESRIDEIKAEVAVLQEVKKELEALKVAETEEPVIETDKKLIKE